MTKRAIVVLNGVIGSGKSTLGQRLAGRLGGLFLDSDDVRDPGKPWFAEVRDVHERLLARIAGHSITIIAEPLRHRDWLHLQRHAALLDSACFCITLAASEDAILSPTRGRVFSAGERARIRQMIAEGYDRRAFSDATLRSDTQGFEQTVEILETTCRELLVIKPGSTSS